MVWFTRNVNVSAILFRFVATSATTKKLVCNELWLSVARAHQPQLNKNELLRTLLPCNYLYCSQSCCKARSAHRKRMIFLLASAFLLSNQLSYLAAARFSSSQDILSYNCYAVSASRSPAIFPAAISTARYTCTMYSPRSQSEDHLLWRWQEE